MRPQAFRRTVRTRCIISLGWLIANSTAGRRNGFSHLRSGTNREICPALMVTYGAYKEKKSVEFWLLPARFIADFFAHWLARRRLISSMAEAISVDSTPKLRAVRSRINLLDMTRNRDLYSIDWITRFRLCSSRAMGSSGIGWLPTTLRSLIYRFTTCFLTAEKKIYIYIEAPCKLKNFFYALSYIHTDSVYVTDLCNCVSYCVSIMKRKDYNVWVEYMTEKE